MSNPQFFATGIGSLPYILPQDAFEFINTSFKADIPFWPQLPKKSFRENMYVQFSQNFPGMDIDEKEKKFSIDTAHPNFNQELELCFMNYLDSNLEYFKVGQDFASGFYEFLTQAPNLANAPYLKGQVIGPITFGLVLLDQRQQPAIYNATISDCLTKFLSMKARWQIQKLKAQCPPKTKIIIFIDEPYLVSYGSSFFTLDRVEVVNRINEVINAIHEGGALAGIHCCGNTDWLLVLDTDLDILSFDAANYLDTFLIYRPKLKRFLDRGGWIAWGIVSNAQGVNWDSDNAPDKLFQIIQSKCADLLKNTSLITPSCGCAGLDINFSEKVHRVSVELAQVLREKYS